MSRVLYNNNPRGRPLWPWRTSPRRPPWPPSFSASARHPRTLDPKILRRLDDYDGRRLTLLRMGLTNRRAVNDTSRGKMYILPMFPYPSGDLHMGHLRVYTISDVLARFRRMQGYDVLHPIGWDAFGLPAENAAIARGIKPATWTTQNIQRMKQQLEAMNGRWDWDRELRTCDPDFYKHTQALFLRLHRAGLAYQAESWVNYDPVDQTVLANEQVDSQGNSWRSGAKVEKKLLKQWFFRITAYQQALHDDLAVLAKDQRWPERVVTMQRHWLGRSRGVKVSFPLWLHGQREGAAVEVFTTRPDTLLGVQYLALAATHPVVERLAKEDSELQSFIEACQDTSSAEKDFRGYLITDALAMHPLSAEIDMPRHLSQPLPIYVAPYVLGHVGKGAVMGVPGHDARDAAFWSRHCPDIAPHAVVANPSEAVPPAQTSLFEGLGVLTSMNGRFAGLTSKEAAKTFVDLLIARDQGNWTETWRLRDWLISRQRYWGTPIPIIHCESCGPVPVPDSDLPVKLPTIQDEHLHRGGNPLDHVHDWVNVACPSCGAAARRETDTMDTFVDSSWYYMRFPDHENPTQLLDPKVTLRQIPVDLYIGGVEHAILHLLYARFISKFLQSTPADDEGSGMRGEPFRRVLTQGMVHGRTYTDPSTCRFLRAEEVDHTDPSAPRMLSTGESVLVSYEKMSKSKYNGVDPMSCIQKHGADATRAHMLFQAPVRDVLLWDESKITGVTRWLDRVERYVLTSSPIWNKHLGDETRDQAARTYFDLNRPLYDGVAREDMDVIRPVFEGVAKRSMTPKERKVEMVQKFAQHEKLWQTVQETIMSVTEAYEETFALNTVVSDLMSLSNVIFETDSADATLLGGHLSQPALLRQASRILVQLMAPITPLVAERCWTAIHDCKTSQHKDSIFELPFPFPDGSLEILQPRTQECAVQINGKLRCSLTMPIPSVQLAGRDLSQWVLRHVLASEDAMHKLHGIDLGGAHRIVVVRQARLVNFVLEKSALPEAWRS